MFKNSGLIISMLFIPLSTVINAKKENSNNRMLVVTSPDPDHLSSTHYVSYNEILLRKSKLPVILNNTPPNLTYQQLDKHIFGIFSKIKEPYILSFYDVENLALFKGIYVLVILREKNMEGLAINPSNIKIYSPVERARSEEAKLAAAALSPSKNYIDVTNFFKNDLWAPSILEQLKKFFKEYFPEFPAFGSDNPPTADVDADESIIYFIQEVPTRKSQMRVIVQIPLTAPDISRLLKIFLGSNSGIWPWTTLS